MYPGNGATMAVELEAAKQREEMAWNHSADLVEVITKLNDALRSEKEGHTATQQHSVELAEEIKKEREAAEGSAKKATEENADLQKKVQEQAALIEKKTRFLNASTRKA